MNGFDCSVSNRQSTMSQKRSFRVARFPEVVMDEDNEDDEMLDAQE
jgi:hypothetical protein